MRLFRSILPAIVVAIAFAPVARAEDKVESPIYKNWAKFAKGTSTTVKTISEFAGNKSEATMTSTLLELTDEKVVVEIVTISKVAGMEFKSPAVKQEYAKQITLPPNVKKEDFGKPMGSFEQGEESVKVNGTEYKAKWYKSKIEVSGNKVETQAWTSEDVPGSVVKSVSKMSGQVAGTTTTELVEVKKP